MKNRKAILAMIGAGIAYELHASKPIEILPMILTEPNRGPRRKRGKGNKYHK